MSRFGRLLLVTLEAARELSRAPLGRAPCGIPEANEATPTKGHAARRVLRAHLGRAECACRYGSTILARYCAANGLPLDAKTFSGESVALLQAYHWPGNIRELESTVSRAALSAPGRVIRDSDIEFLHAQATPREETSTRLPSLREAERSHIGRVLEAVSWNKKEAARVLDISRGTLYRKIVEFGLEPESAASRNRTRRTLVS